MKRWFDLLPAAPAAYLATLFVACLAARLTYPFDLEWMEGGMLAHAWRLERGLPIYSPPDGTWIPYVYPPGFSALLASLPGGVDYVPGRLLSWAGSLAAAGAMVQIVWRQGRSWALGLVFAALFWGTFRTSGGFFDLVRPDALAIGLGAWALALSVDGRKGTEVAGGLLLCAAFLVKHNLAVFGVPLALGLWGWRGWRTALRFGLSSAVPALLFLGYLQWRSGGGLLTYIVSVPGSHPLVMQRFAPGTQNELGHWLGFALNAGALGLVAAAPRRFTAVHPAVAWGAAAVVGAGAAWWGVSQGTVPGAARAHWLVTALTFFSLGGLVASAVVAAMAGAVERKVDGEWWTGAGVLLLGVALGSWMRAHNGGFINVLIPVHWVILALAGIVLGQLRHHFDHVATWALTALVAAGQALWLVHLTDFTKVTPTQADIDGGMAVVETVREHCSDGPVFSPYASWMPVLIGQDPSLHLIALWDIDHKEGPLYADVKRVREAIARKDYVCVVEFGRKPFGYGVPKHYRQQTLLKGKPNVLRPKTGWSVRPRALMVPK